MTLPVEPANLVGGDDLFIHRTAALSEDGLYRWSLRRWWGEGKRVCFIGLNPSTADHLVDDPTVRRWIHFARSWGYDGFVAVNLFPLRTSNPKECQKWADYEQNGPDWYARDAIQHNIGYVSQVAKASALVVACWGAFEWPEHMGDIESAVVEEIMTGVEPWPDIYCFGTTKNGSPIHPMARGKHRVQDDAKPTIWKAQCR